MRAAPWGTTGVFAGSNAEIIPVRLPVSDTFEPPFGARGAGEHRIDVAAAEAQPCGDCELSQGQAESAEHK